MKKYEELSKKKVDEVEACYSEYWEKNNIFQKSIDKGKDNFVFYDGPATANGYPGLHHMLAKFLKDTFCKYKTMKGYKVNRKIGWDTHGLPVELEVEKELGFTSKSDIEKYGIDKFNQKCRESVMRNEKLFSDLTTKMGQFIDLKNPYVTYHNSYIETEWWILKKFFDEGLFYEGHKILPYCPRCGTGLASHEVAQGYKDVAVDTVIVPFECPKLDAYFLVWTTTPWTLLSNVALCVNPDEEYVKVSSMGYNFILAKKLASSILGDEYTVLETYKGKDLEYVEYEQLLPFIEVKDKAFFVTNDTYVSMEDGTGIVHIAPAFGLDDYEIGKRYHLPMINPVSEDGKYLEGPWKDVLVFDADIEIIKYLKENDKLFKKQRLNHNYPHCWRCQSPLIYFSKPSYYLEVTKIKDKVIEENKKVNWYPKHVGEKRFGNWLENMNDWALSRNRYWGTPLPLWRCECGHMEMIGSRAELVEKSIETIDETIDLHRPYVDNVHIKCLKCGKKMNRVPEVIDCWFDSGSMPFAQYHYPFENKELFESQFPADFICEGIDQTRGWFYTLILISTFVMGKAPYKNVLVNDLLLDSEGKKMSKSRGNAINPFGLIEEYGADVVRFYMPFVSPVWMPLKFDMEGLKEVYSKFFNPLKNTYNFYAMYANADQIDLDSFEVSYDKLEEIDLWMLSKLNKLIKYVTESYEEYDLNKVVKALTEFVSEDLSNWYIRRNRDRFWSSELNDSKKAVYTITYNVLSDLCKLSAPIVPFITEEIYQKLTGEESVHLAEFPQYNEEAIDLKLETKMDLVRDLISIGRMVREEAKIKVRQPLSEILLDQKSEDIIGNLVTLIKEELNVKKITYTKHLSDYMDLSVKPNYKEVGKILGSKIKLFADKLITFKNDEIVKLQNHEEIIMDLDGEEITVTENMVEIRISSREGLNVGTDNKNFVILNTEITEELYLEGLARELVNKIQNMRKEQDLNVADRIIVSYKANEKVEQMIKEYEEYIRTETLAIKLNQKDNLTNKIDLNEHEVFLEIEKAN
ncbi:MAG: isoleucine--tRNA ligase [Mollicutes bacterium]|nr:isoleucine--tRNA ligase [Mollicutes bacterium]